MDVTIIHDGNTTYPDPPLDPEWPDRKKLEWKAAVASERTGLRISITDGSCKMKVRGEWVSMGDWYSVHVSTRGRNIGTVFDFRSAWDFINGIEEGVQFARAAQPTDAEVEAACRAFYEATNPHLDSSMQLSWDRLIASDSDVAENYRRAFMPALLAAQKVRAGR